MANNIVTVQVSQQVAPAPSTLQRTGALISQGGTNTAANTLSLLTEPSDLTSILGTAKTLSTLAWNTNVVTATTTAPHGWPDTKSFLVTIAGVTPSAYNGTFLATVTGTTTFTYALSPDPGSMSIPGTVTIADVSQLTAMATTFFAQGSAASVYVLELGVGSVDDGVAELSSFLTSNPQSLYRLLVPREWDVNSTFLAMLNTYDGTTAKLYFHVTSTTGTYTTYNAQQKSAMVWIEAPTIPVTEFTAAADFYVALNYNPSTTNKVTPNAFAYLFGVTPYPTKGNNALFTALKAANINIVGTGAEGGVTTSIALWGTMLDGNDLTYWYSVDWVQINVQRDLANEIINGSNNPLAPLYYDQNGINRLQARAQATMNQGISNGLVLAPATVGAVSFNDYVRLNPQDYPVGAYNGLSTEYTPNRGFKSIVFNVIVSNIPLA